METKDETYYAGAYKITSSNKKIRVVFGGFILIVGTLLVCLMFSGCGPTQGWSVGFGVYPISQVQQEQALKPAVRLVKANRVVAED
jgi:hypothetical protein